VAATAPRMGMVSSAILASRIIEKIRPKIITMCGICAGVKEKVSIGDVLFADVSWDFQSGKKVVDKDIAKLSVAPHQISADQIIRSHIAELIQDTELMCDIHKNFGLPPYPIPKIFVGPVTSGSVVLADGQTIKEISSQHRELIGVEKEVYGLYAAATSSSDPRPKVFALKSVCDFADPEKDDEAQKYAAYTSARVLQALMQRYSSRLLHSIYRVFTLIRSIRKELAAGCRQIVSIGKSGLCEVFNALSPFKDNSWKALIPMFIQVFIQFDNTAKGI